MASSQLIKLLPKLPLLRQEKPKQWRPPQLYRALLQWEAIPSARRMLSLGIWTGILGA
jgi:hypothetical protein